jgi:hypothetical protein
VDLNLINRIMKRTAITLVFLLCFSAVTSAQTIRSKSILGVWKITEITTTGQSNKTIANPQPGLMTIGRKYYSMTYNPGDKTRTPFAGDIPTDREKLDAFDTLIASAGTYELSGDLFTISPLIAKNPGFEAGGGGSYRVRRHGNELWLIYKSTDLRFRQNGKLVPAGGPVIETTLKFVKVE